MQTSDYYRARAKMCLRIAQSISDRGSAERLRLDAAQYLERADEIDAGRGVAQASPPLLRPPVADNENK